MAIDADAAGPRDLHSATGVSPFMVAGAQGNYMIATDGRPHPDAARRDCGQHRARREEVAEADRAACESHIRHPAVRHGSPHPPSSSGSRQAGCHAGLPRRLTAADRVVDAAIRLARSHHVAAGRDTAGRSSGGSSPVSRRHTATMRWWHVTAARAWSRPPRLPKGAVAYCLSATRAHADGCVEAGGAGLEDVILREGPDTVAAFIAGASSAAQPAPSCHRRLLAQGAGDLLEVRRLLIADES